MNKIEALQKTIYNLENDVYEYNWTNCNSCNCGVLARTLLNGKNVFESGFDDSPITKSDFEAFSEEAFCMTTNLPLPEVFAVLKQTGFTFKEVDELENLSNEKIRNNLGWEINSKLNRSEKTSVILYLKEWVKMLQENEPKAKFVTYSKIIQNIPVNAN
jgi:hypothetical protein